MKQVFLSLFVFLLIHLPVHAQTYSGVIKDKRSSKPVAFANIGIQDTQLGTYSAEDGTFSITIKKNLNTPLLIISALGYETKSIDLSGRSPSEKTEILLTPKEYELGTFTVEGSRIRTRIIGNKRMIPRVKRMAYSAGAGGSRIGKSIAIRVELKQQPPIRIDSASIAIEESPWKEARFRARVKAIDPQNGAPGDDLSPLYALSSFNKKSGWVTFSFPDSLVIQETSFFVVIENLDETGEMWSEDQLATLYPTYLFSFPSFSKQPVFLSDESLQSWKAIKEDPVFNLTFAYE